MNDGDKSSKWPAIIRHGPKSEEHATAEKNKASGLGFPNVPTDELGSYADACRQYFEENPNIYVAFEVLLTFHRHNLYPPDWVIDEIAARIQKHLLNPDPELLASHFGVIGRGSGAKNPYREFANAIVKPKACCELLVLIMQFNISLTLAARAVIAKNDLSISPKRMLAIFREELGNDPKRFQQKNLSRQATRPFESEAAARRFLSGFPIEIRNTIARKHPIKT